MKACLVHHLMKEYLRHAFAGLVKDVSDFYSSQRKISQVCWVMKF